MKPLKEALGGKSFVILRPKVGKKERMHAVRFAKSQVGKGYNSTALAVTGMGRVLPTQLARLSGHLVDDITRKGGKFWQCSELVSAAYAKAGLSGKRPFLTAPVDLRLDPKVKTVATHTLPGFKEKGPLTKSRGMWKQRKAEEVAPTIPAAPKLPAPTMKPPAPPEVRI